MNRPEYDRRKVRRAMLIAPAAALLGLVPYLFVLNLSAGQVLAFALIALVLCYIGGLVFGAPGYLVLKALGYSQTAYLMGYAVVLVVVATIVLEDVYVLVSLGPPVLLAAGAFCYLRGAAVEPQPSAVEPQPSAVEPQPS